MTREEAIAEMEQYINEEENWVGTARIADWLTALRASPGPSLPDSLAGSQSCDGGLGERGAEFERELKEWLCKLKYGPSRADWIPLYIQNEIAAEARKLAEKWFGRR